MVVADAVRVCGDETRVLKGGISMGLAPLGCGRGMRAIYLSWFPLVLKSDHTSLLSLPLDERSANSTALLRFIASKDIRVS
jgi:hypothetical protein